MTFDGENPFASADLCLDEGGDLEATIAVLGDEFHLEASPLRVG